MLFGITLIIKREAIAKENIGVNVTDRSGRDLADRILAVKDGTIEFADPREVYLRKFDLGIAAVHYRELIDGLLPPS